jgi:hypothetical protein
MTVDWFSKLRGTDSGYELRHHRITRGEFSCSCGVGNL